MNQSPMTSNVSVTPNNLPRKDPVRPEHQINLSTTGKESSRTPPQIQIRSTFDCDMILRKIIEDRAAILTLRGEAERNEKELLKAKAWQMQTAETLNRLDKEIAKEVAKHKYEIEEYNEASKQYIRGFVSAFEYGDIDKLQHHPFLPSLKALDEVIARRRATHIEKVQADERVRKMEVINSKHHITKSVVKKNEEAFVRAIAIAKEQFSGSCGSWLRELDGMLSDVPNWSHSTVFGKKSRGSGDSKKDTNQVSEDYNNLSQRSMLEKDEKRKHKRSVDMLSNTEYAVQSSKGVSSQDFNQDFPEGRKKQKKVPETKKPSIDLRREEYDESNQQANENYTTFSQMYNNFLDDVSIAEALTRLGR